MALILNTGALSSSALTSPKCEKGERQPVLKKNGQRGHVRAEAPDVPLDREGRYWAKNVMWVLNISHSALYAGFPRGRYPEPDGYDGHRPYWNTKTIREFKNAEDLAWANKKAFLESIGLKAQRPTRRSTP